MPIKAQAGPQLEPVSLAQAKAHLNILGDTRRDEELVRMIRGAREYCETFIDRLLVGGNYLQRLDCWPDDGVIRLRGPVQSITSVKYIDVAGDQQTMDPADYQVDIYSEPARIVPAPSTTWPALGAGFINSVEVDFVGGFESPVKVPAAAAQAILLIVGDMFRYRDSLQNVVSRHSDVLHRLLWSVKR